MEELESVQERTETVRESESIPNYRSSEEDSGEDERQKKDLNKKLLKGKKSDNDF